MHYCKQIILLLEEQTYARFSGGSRPSAKEGARLTMNVEFCGDNSGTSKKMRYFRKNKVPPLDPRWNEPADYIRHLVPV